MIKKFILACALVGALQLSAAQNVQPIFASTRYIVRSDLPHQVGYKRFNDLILELKKSSVNEQLAEHIRQRLNMRLAIMYLINDHVVDCMRAQVIEQLAKTKAVTDIEKQKITEELTQINPRDPQYVEAKFMRNIKATEQDYGSLTQAGVNLKALREIVSKLVRCEFFKNIIESRRSTWLFGGAQYYVKENILTYINRYLLLVEEAVRHIFSDESLQEKKSAIESLITKVQAMRTGDSKLEKEMLATFTSVLPGELELAGGAVTAESKATSVDQVFSLSVSLGALS